MGAEGAGAVKFDIPLIMQGLYRDKCLQKLDTFI